MNAQEIITYLKKLSNVRNIEGMARFGINPETALGISIPILRKKAKKMGHNHKLALDLWDSDIHEIRILATMIDDPSAVTKVQMNSWVKDFNSWDLCDQCCLNLFRKTTIADEIIFVWANSNHEFTRRAAFALIATIAVHKKEKIDEDFIEYLGLIIEFSTDERNFVKKAVNWALRQIGKRNLKLNREAIIVCEQLLENDSKSAVWIAKDALRELTSEKIISRLKKKSK